MFKYYLVIVLCFFSNMLYAGYGTGEIKRFYAGGDGSVYFGLVTQLPNTCSNWSEHFKFDALTSGGKNMLSVLMSAKLANKRVYVWYTDSSNPGTDQTSGCSGNAISILLNIGIQ